MAKMRMIMKGQLLRQVAKKNSLMMKRHISGIGWDRSLRAWVPQENSVAADTEKQTSTTVTNINEYDLENMTFLQEDELFPTISTADDDVSLKGKLTAVVDTKRDPESEVTTNADKKNAKRKLDEQPAEKKEANKPPDSWFELKVNTHVCYWLTR